MKKTLYFLLISIAIVSCRAKKPADTQNNTAIDSITVAASPKNTAGPKPASEAVRDRITFYEKTIMPLQFDQIKMTGKIDIQADAYVPTLNSVIYIENNNKIWANLSLMMFTAARGIATPQGVKGYEKYDSNYIDSNFEYLNKLLNVNFIDYKSFEKLLLGRTFLKVNDREFSLTKNPNGFDLVSNGTQKFTADGKEREYRIRFTYDTDYHLTGAELKDIKSPDQLTVVYENWKTFGKIDLPQNVKIVIKGSKNGQIFLENTKFEFSRMATPYAVPSGYKKIEIK